MKNFWFKYRIAFTASIVVIIIVAVLLGARAHYGLTPFNRLIGHTALHPAVTVTVAPITKTDKIVQLMFRGTVEGRKASAVTAGTSGRISEIYVTEGQPVKKGQPLMSIQQLALANGHSAVTDDSPASPTGNDNPEAQANYDHILQQYNRYQKLYEQGAIARRQLEDTAARLKIAQEALAGTPAAMQTATADASPQQDSVAVPLVASTDGIVTGLASAAGTTVQAGQQLMLLESGNEIQAGVQLQQKDLYFVRSGTPAEITADNVSDKILAGQVESIYPGGNQLFRTQLKIDNTSGILKPGMAVTIRINTGKSALVATVPATAVFEEQGLSYLYLAVNGKAVRQQVSIGETLGDALEITSPLPEQALIVTSQVNDLQDGDPLTIQSL